jgi:phosphatidylserine/phosphatidylglycerophosphate/cardiolipin synthase-like enzyme
VTRRFAGLAALLLAACAPPPAEGADAGPDAGTADAGPRATDGGCGALDPRSVPVTLAVLPDAGEAPYVDVLSRAAHDIRVMVYELGAGGILTSLLQKAGAGVAVRVILDQSKKDVNQKYADQLTAAGAQVHWSDPAFTYMHAKSLLVDGTDAVISTGNYSYAYSIAVERNYVMHDADPDDAADLAALFDADWDGRAPDLACTRLVVSPVNARARLLALLDGAAATLDVESMQFADSDVRARVAARAQAGVAVRVLLADPGWITANTDAASFLKGKRIPVRHLATPHVHVKSIIVDGVRAYAGSENLSYTSLSKNREVGLELGEADAVASMKATFEKDWAAATAF